MQLKFIISGGGTGGHIFPAVAVAQELRKRYPDCDILFVGAHGRMEMEKVPAEGFPIVGLKVSGLKRSLSPSNFKVIFQFLSSYFKARRLLKTFKPHCVLGTGGYASLAVLRAATQMKFPTVIWEGNGHAGLTNRILAKKVNTICTGLPNMENFFPSEKTVYTGNPVRQEILHLPSKDEGCSFFRLDPNKKTVFITGGSLGARTINHSMEDSLAQLIDSGIQVIWQTGKNFTSYHTGKPGIHIIQFIKEMNLAYAAADLVISRAGALSIAEITAAGKASILVPSPNVTDDHQTKNAQKLSDNGAAILLSDKETHEKLIPLMIESLSQPEKLIEMGKKSQQMAMPGATQKIAEEILKLCRQ